jgi:hypothetical protein
MAEKGSDGHEVVALERAALERWGKGDPSGFLEICVVRHGPRAVPLGSGIESRMP